MTRSKWPLYSAITSIIFVLTGVVLWKMLVPASSLEPYDIRQLGLGTQRTLVIAMSTDCKPCLESMEFYKSLMLLPAADGSLQIIEAFTKT